MYDYCILGVCSVAISASLPNVDTYSISMILHDIVLTIHVVYKYTYLVMLEKIAIVNVKHHH